MLIIDDRDDHSHVCLLPIIDCRKTRTLRQSLRTCPTSLRGLIVAVVYTPFCSYIHLQCCSHEAAARLVNNNNFVHSSHVSDFSLQTNWLAGLDSTCDR